jgi:pimeloyl-ACP methyl ester carboxylesterase
VHDTATLLNAAGVSQVAIVGTSLGGVVGTLMAAVMPAKVLGLVINDIGPEIAPAGLQRIAGYVGKGEPVKTWDEAAAAVQSIDGATFPEYGKDDWLKVARRRFVEAPDGTIRTDYDFNIARAFGSSITRDMWPFFLRLRRLPSLTLRGANSDLLTSETLTRMGRLIPTMTCVEVPNRAHAPYLDEPVAVAAIDTFLARLPSRLGVMTRLRRSVSAAGFVMGLKLAGQL